MRSSIDKKLEKNMKDVKKHLIKDDANFLYYFNIKRDIPEVIDFLQAYYKAENLKQLKQDNVLDGIYSHLKKMSLEPKWQLYVNNAFNTGLPEKKRASLKALAENVLMDRALEYSSYLEYAKNNPVPPKVKRKHSIWDEDCLSDIKAPTYKTNSISFS